MKQTKLTANDRGRHAELLAATALLANGYSVLEPVSPQPYDLAIRDRYTLDTYYVQIKTALLRGEPNDLKRYGREYLRISGARNSGDVYLRDEVDYVIAVWDGECYVFANREISEYWISVDELKTDASRWKKLETFI